MVPKPKGCTENQSYFHELVGRFERLMIRLLSYYPAQASLSRHVCFIPLCLVVLLSHTGLAASDHSAGANASSTGLDRGYHQMYNLQFEEAHRTFRNWEQSHPNDPLGPTSNAAAYLFAEFERLGILQSELFVDDDAFVKRAKLTPDPAAKQAFDQEIARSEQIADRVLAQTPRDGNALFARLLNLGMKSDYYGLIEKRYLTSLVYRKNTGILADRLLAIDPSCYDAYLAIGVENYILSFRAAPVRWLLRMYGVQTDRQKGIANLRLTAEKGRYLAPFARLLLGVAALRNHDRNQAREILVNLVREFPNNHLYRQELERFK